VQWLVLPLHPLRHAGGPKEGADRTGVARENVRSRGRGFHSFTSQVNLSRFVTEILQPSDVSYKKCPRQAEKWTSVSPCQEDGGAAASGDVLALAAKAGLYRKTLPLLVLGHETA